MLNAQLLSNRNLVFLLVYIVDDKLKSGFGNRRLNLLNKRRKEEVVAAVYYHQNGFCNILPHSARIPVGSVIVFAYYLVNFFASFFADFTASVQRPRNSADAAARQLRNILYCQFITT